MDHATTPSGPIADRDPEAPISVLLVDDQPLLRMGFRLILEGEPDLRIVGEASDGRKAWPGRPAAARRRADGRADADDGRHRGDPAHRRGRRLLADHHPDHLDLDEYAFAGAQAGASGFMLKDVAAGGTGARRAAGGQRRRRAWPRA